MSVLLPAVIPVANVVVPLKPLRTVTESETVPSTFKLTDDKTLPVILVT